MTGLLQQIAERLSARCLSLSSVTPGAVAAELETHALGEVPIVLVVPAAERWSEVREAGMKVSAGGRFAFSCVLGMTSPAGVVEWEAARQEIRAALLGWTPLGSDIAGPVQAAGARLLAFSAEAGGRWLHAFDFNLPVQASYEHQA